MKIRLLESNDWEGLYINGKLIMEGHSLSLYEVLHNIFWKGNTFKRVYINKFEEYDNRCPDEWLPELEEKANQT